jgi:K+-sensing histidine kinase KdpD
MPNSNKQIDFSTVLAAGVHDMKNSLCLLLQSVENLSRELPQHDDTITTNLASLQYEAFRLNTGLMQLLSLYRAEKQQLPVSIDEVYVEDIIDDILATNETYITNKQMELEINQPEELAWYLDGDLVNLLLNDILINAMRYSNKKLKLSCFEEGGFLNFTLEDDGPGYPEAMLRAGNTDMQDFDIGSGRTGLGLFFARMIAQAHTNNGKTGSIHLQNGGNLGGSVFTLKIP